ncbi:MAG: conserved phage C-terminal domain-containing protein [SAR324 cluster bacterium]|nr:conserved phage C-terminal domain-containing protein [SAR324 cluster bacterium]
MSGNQEYFAATVPARVWQDKRLSLNDIRLLLALMSFNGGGLCNPKLAALKERSNLCKQRIHESKIRLKRFEWISENESGFLINMENSIELVGNGKRDHGHGKCDREKVTESVTRGNGKRDQKVTESVTGGNGKRDQPIIRNEIESEIESEIEKEIKECDSAQISFPEIANQLIDFLNAKANKDFRHTSNNRKNIIARLKEKYSKTDCEFVIENQAAIWLGTEMETYLNPETLFRPSKFEKYRNTPKFIPKQSKQQQKTNYGSTIASKNVAKMDTFIKKHTEAMNGSQPPKQKIIQQRALL